MARVSLAGIAPRATVHFHYCPIARLPDCLASRLSGSLSEIEAVILQVEQANSINTAAEQLRPDIELPGVLRWIRCRIKGIQSALAIIKELYSERFTGCQLTITAFSQHINGNDVLFALREIAASHLVVLAPPLGFKPPPPIILYSAVKNVQNTSTH